MVTTATLVMITSIRSVSVYLDIFPFFFYFGEQVSQADVVFEYAKFSVHPNIGDQNIGLQTIRQDYYVAAYLTRNIVSKPLDNRDTIGNYC